jgi:hypothetical protein
MAEDTVMSRSPSLIGNRPFGGCVINGQPLNNNYTMPPIQPVQTVEGLAIEYQGHQVDSSGKTSDAKPASALAPYLGLPTTDKERKRLQLDTFLFEYFPDVFLAVANVAIAGNEQHNKGEPLHWAREKSTDQLNTAFRHYWDYRRGIKKDTDGQWHLAKAIWRLSAQLQLDIEEDRRASAGADRRGP